MKSNHIFWALTLLAIIVFLPSLFWHTNAKLGIGPNLVLIYLLIWIVLSITTPFLLMLERIGAVPGEHPFIFTLLSLLNFYFGLYGLYLIFSKELAKPTPLTICLFTLNLVWSVAIFITLRSKKGNRSPS
jgi:hypothetical protein